jgi:hypothetical protein
MPKKKSTQELLATRNPFTRAAVAPVDIYEQPKAAEPEPAPEPKPKKSPSNSAKTSSKPTAKAKPGRPKNPATADPVNPYSTYLRKSQVKQIKYRAIDRDLKDQEIVQEAIDEYFRRHPE